MFDKRLNNRKEYNLKLYMQKILNQFIELGLFVLDRLLKKFNNIFKLWVCNKV